jgi:hypothetical protein
MIRRHWLRAPLAIVLGTLWLLPAFARELRVGVGKASVTPGVTDFPYMPSDKPSLNTGPGERSFVGVHDEVFARALVIDDGVQRAVLVVLEVTAVPAAEEMTKAIARQFGIPASNVVIAATHTHSVPLFSYAGAEPSAREAREIERLKRGAVEAVRQASSQVQLARVAFGRGQGWINVNNGEQSGSKNGYDPAGPSDKTLDVVRFDTRESVPIAMLVNYASHAEVMFRSVTRNDGYEVSGDLPGAVSRILETQPEAAPIVLFTSAAEADQLTLFKSLQFASRLPAADEGAAGWALLDVQARRLAGSVMEVLAAMRPGEGQANIAVGSGSVTCPGQQLRIDSRNGQVLVEDLPPVTIPLSMIRLNNIVLAGVGGDVASEIGRHFKASSPYVNSMLISMAGHSVGYVFSDASYEHPGHGLTKSPLKPNCADRAIVDGLVDIIKAKP